MGYAPYGNLKICMLGRPGFKTPDISYIREVRKRRRVMHQHNVMALRQALVDFNVPCEDIKTSKGWGTVVYLLGFGFCLLVNKQQNCRPVEECDLWRHRRIAEAAVKEIPWLKRAKAGSAKLPGFEPGSEFKPDDGESEPLPLLIVAPEVNRVRNAYHVRVPPYVPEFYDERLCYEGCLTDLYQFYTEVRNALRRLVIWLAKLRYGSRWFGMLQRAGVNVWATFKRVVGPHHVLRYLQKKNLWVFRLWLDRHPERVIDHGDRYTTHYKPPPA